MRYLLIDVSNVVVEDFCVKFDELDFYVYIRFVQLKPSFFLLIHGANVHKLVTTETPVRRWKVHYNITNEGCLSSLSTVVFNRLRETKYVS